MMHWGPVCGWGGSPGTMLLWLAVIVVAVYLLTGRRLHTKTDLSISSKQPVGALAILEERYARGEIDEDEFLRKRRMLKQEK